MAFNACYKLMRYIGIIDLFLIPISGTLTGYLAINGYSFCSYPTLIYFTGSISLGAQKQEKISPIVFTAQLNGINNPCAQSLFRNDFSTTKQTKFWLITPTIYGLYFVLFATPVAFSSVHMSCFFNPFKGYNDTVGHLVNDTIEPLSLIVIYTTFCIVVSVRSAANKTGKNAVQNGAKRKAQILSFFQVFLISVVNVVACSIYVLMNIVPISPLLIIIGTFGLPPVIFLTLNRTIRRDTLKMLCCGHFTGSKNKVCGNTS
ncbi:hypothetical protein M3Y98_00921000 [Aphelenchoides besseyi]|nr:hypothetical protein M3Y98_00921000 [Aphelenchoides besseyi]KAI6193436.1 hypothetical protein M3Y96_01017500 [Aphelenchoides besseyi]